MKAFKNKRNNNLVTSHRRGTGTRRYRVNRNPLRYQFGTRTNSALGREFRTCLLTGFINSVATNTVQFNLAQIFSGREATSVFSNWLYGKLQSIIVTVEPNNLNTSNKPGYLVLIWSNEYPNNLESMNNVKIIPAFRTRTLSYYYQVPEFESSALILRKYKGVADFMSSEFYLYLHSPGNSDTWNIRIDLKMKFKGSKIIPGSEKTLTLEPLITHGENEIVVEPIQK